MGNAGDRRKTSDIIPAEGGHACTQGSPRHSYQTAGFLSASPPGEHG